MPFNGYGASPRIDVVFNEREKDVSTISQIETGKLQGRFRNEGASARAVPSSNTDTVRGDAEGDIVYDGSALYICLKLNDTLEWREIALASV